MSILACPSISRIIQFTPISTKISVVYHRGGKQNKKKIRAELRIFSYPLILTEVSDAQKNRLIETVLLSTHNICFG